jgi:hypothetical protein
LFFIAAPSKNLCFRAQYVMESGTLFIGFGINHPVGGLEDQIVPSSNGGNGREGNGHNGNGNGGNGHAGNGNGPGKTVTPIGDGNGNGNGGNGSGSSTPEILKTPTVIGVTF